MARKRKVVLVTGASSGIGLRSALRLIKDGHTVYGGARNTDAMAPIGAAGGKVLSLDVTDDASMQQAIGTIAQAEGRLDVLVNNAGYGLYGAVEDTSMDVARAQMEVNVFGLARMTQLALPLMRDAGKGTIINLSSMGGTIYMPLGAWYHGSKHFVEGFSDSLRLEVKQFGINVVLIAPGAIKTEFNSTMRDLVLQSSGNGAYSKLAELMANAADPDRGSDPDVIADDISRAVKARKPKTRYRSGQMSVSLPRMRRMLSDRMFDRIIMSAIK